MWLVHQRSFSCGVLLLLVLTVQSAFAGVAIEDYEQRPEIQNRLLEERLDSLLPTLMRETGVDMWLVIAREYNDDPVFLSLVPKPRFTARRTTMLVFFDRGDAGVERLTVSRYPLGAMYEAAWEGGDLDAQWQRLAEVIAERDPQTIAVNTSDTWPVADGISHSLYSKLAASLRPELRTRLQSSERLVVRWMETRTEGEVEVWQRAVAIARETIARAFSSEVITPGVTTVGDVSWFIRTRFEEEGLEPWFHPDVNRQWQGADFGENAPFLGDGSKDGIIRRGDVLHTDVGLCYLGLCTDTQEMGYVLKLGESEPPEGLGRGHAHRQPLARRVNGRVCDGSDRERDSCCSTREPREIGHSTRHLHTPLRCIRACPRTHHRHVGQPGTHYWSGRLASVSDDGLCH